MLPYVSVSRPPLATRALVVPPRGKRRTLLNPEKTQQAKKKGPAELIETFRSEPFFWEIVDCLERVRPDPRHSLTPMEVCLWTLIRCREELRCALLNDLSGGVAKALRVLEHERIFRIFTKAIDEQDFQASPHFIRFTTSVVASALVACSREQHPR